MGQNYIFACDAFYQDNRFTTITLTGAVSYTYQFCAGNAVSDPTLCHYENNSANGGGSTTLTAMTDAEIKALPTPFFENIPTGRFYAGKMCCNPTTQFFFPSVINFGDGSYSDSGTETGGSDCTGPPCTTPSGEDYTIMSATLVIYDDPSNAGKYAINGGLCAPAWCADLTAYGCGLIDSETFYGSCDGTGIIGVTDVDITTMLGTTYEGTYEIPDAACTQTTPCDDTHEGKTFSGSSSLSIAFA